ncbi:MAG: PDC sensor domain-containing protein, partial [Rhodobacteraceae bacterium]|nr:PDC sensor domain-containing protein [Paracoccaceae bacterium]
MKPAVPQRVMRIQSKLFFVLLILSVIPLTALTWRIQRATEGLGESIVAGGKSAVTESIENQLVQAIDYSSELLSIRQKLVETALRAQAGEVRRLLAAAAPDDPAAGFYFDTAFDNPVTWPPGTELSLDRAAVAGGRSLEAMAISREVQSFFVPADVAPPMDDIARLKPLTAAYKNLNAANPGLFYWQYVALANGVLSSYPGHGGYPDGYDPRRRIWYQLAMAAGNVIWTPPILDAATRRLILTSAMPVRGADGQFAGVTAIDVDILTQLATIHDKMRLGPRAESFIVRLTDKDGEVFIAGESSGLPELRVIASSATAASGASWDATIEEPPLFDELGNTETEIVSDLLSGKGGLRRMPYKGVESIWVYREIGRLASALFYIVPVDDIEGLADRAQDSIRAATMEQVRLAGLASVGLIALVGLAAMFASRTVSRPLRALAATARELAGGNLE